MFDLGMSLKFRKEFLKYPEGFATEVIGFDNDGDPQIRMPDGSKDVFFAQDLFDLVDIIDTSEPVTTPETPTLRDQFAMAALTGMISQSNGTAFGSCKADGAKWAYAMSDAMLAERERVK